MFAKKIGLTGGIAAGKTTAQRLFEELGVHTIDHDILARDAVAPGSSGLQSLTQNFGPEILDENNCLDRKKLKEIIFQNSAMKKQVEDIIHPLVFQASERILQRKSAEPYVLIVSPLLIESGSARDMARLVVVEVPEALQLKRLLQRDGMSKELAMSIIRSQATPSQRAAAADYVLDNSQGIEHLKKQVDACHQSLLNFATGS